MKSFFLCCDMIKMPDAPFQDFLVQAVEELTRRAMELAGQNGQQAHAISVTVTPLIEGSWNIGIVFAREAVIARPPSVARMN